MKYQVVAQYSEEDCGAACLASIAKHYRHNLYTKSHPGSGRHWANTVQLRLKTKAGVGWVEEGNPTLSKFCWVTLTLNPTYYSLNPSVLGTK